MTKGSFSIRPNGTMSEPARNKAWFYAVASAAKLAYPNLPTFEEPVHVDMTFLVPMPKGGHEVGEPAVSRRCGDIDKLARGVLDAISGGTQWGWPIILDDSHVFILKARKFYHEKSGVLVKIRPVCGRDRDEWDTIIDSLGEPSEDELNDISEYY